MGNMDSYQKKQKFSFTFLLRCSKGYALMTFNFTYIHPVYHLIEISFHVRVVAVKNQNEIITSTIDSSLANQLGKQCTMKFTRTRKLPFYAMVRYIITF